MNWLATLLNPIGKTPSLAFTRAWTLLFLMRFFMIFGVGFILTILGISGINTENLSVNVIYLTGFVFLLTSMLSVVIHIRRLNDAGRSSLWAMIILIPLLLGSAVALAGITRAAGEYAKNYELRAAYLADPEAWQEQRKDRPEQPADEGDTASSSSEWSGGRGSRSAQAPYRADNVLPGQEASVLRPNIRTFYTMMMLFSAFVVPWSLLWVARLPSRTDAGPN